MANPDGTPGNLTPPWPPGRSGNPDGRPVGSVSLVSLLKRKLAEGNAEAAEAIVDAWIMGARCGDMRHIAAIVERIDGKAADRSEITGEGGGPVELKVIVEYADHPPPALPAPPGAATNPQGSDEV